MAYDSPAKIMLVTNQLHDSPAGGRELLCKLNHDVLKDIYGERCVVFELFRSQKRGGMSIINAFRGHLDGLNDLIIGKALGAIQSENVDKVFVDGSNLGELSKAIKQKFPDVEVATFFHNVEARFFWGSFKQVKSLRALAVFIANYLAERKAVRYSDKIICLSERDSRLLHKFYGRAATHISPMALQDKLTPDAQNLPVRNARERFALFVGGGFYANRAGIDWFVKHVVPRINIKVCIVGRGFEDIKSELERGGKVEVVGAVDSLATWYRDAHFVIAPIFDGSGMKTKVAEALMYGKKVVGTPEAFSGYEDIAEQAGYVCETADQFIAAIENIDELLQLSYDKKLREVYEKYYSLTAAHNRLSAILNE
jgi:glycosyltransferase involved in cell wall biosynthesis